MIVLYVYLIIGVAYSSLSPSFAVWVSNITIRGKRIGIIAGFAFSCLTWLYIVYMTTRIRLMYRGLEKIAEKAMAELEANNMTPTSKFHELVRELNERSAVIRNKAKKYKK